MFNIKILFFEKLCEWNEEDKEQPGAADALDSSAEVLTVWNNVWIDEAKLEMFKASDDTNTL